MAVILLPFAIVAVIAIFVGAPWAIHKKLDLPTLLIPALCWLLLFHFTGDRRLFFPYAIMFAATLALRTTWAHAIGLVALFLMIRVLQDAAMNVLLVELVVAIAALLPIYFVQKRWQLNWPGRAAVALASSMLAFFGLIF